MVVFWGKWGDEIGGGKWYEGGFIFPVVFWDGVRIDPVIFGFFLGVKKGCFCSDKVFVKNRSYNQVFRSAVIRFLFACRRIFLDFVL